MTLLLGFAAVNTGNNLLYLLVSALLGFMAVSGLLGQQNLQRLDIRFLPVRELYAGTPSPIVAEVKNQHRWLPVFLLRVGIPGTDVLLPLLPARQKLQLNMSLNLPARGYQQLPQVRITSCFPINFFVRSRYFNLNQQVLIFPRPLSSILPSGTGDRSQARRDDLLQPGIDGEQLSIDDYRSGDSIKSIHWKLSAKHEEGYKVKRLSRLGAPSLLLDLDNISGTLEEKLSRCTYLVNHYMQQQRPVGLQLDSRRLLPALGTVHRHKLLAELALYAQG